MHSLNVFYSLYKCTVHTSNCCMYRCTGTLVVLHPKDTINDLWYCRRCGHMRALPICNRARELLEWEALKVLDVRFYGSRWPARGDRFPRTTPRRLLRSLYIKERGARARALGCHSSCLRSRFASQFGDDSRLCWRSGLVSGLVSDLVSGLCSPLCRRSASFSAGAQFSSLFRFCLISASATPLARRVALYTLQYSIPSEDYGIQPKTFPKTFCDLPH